MNRERVGLIFGGQSPEHEISVLSARSVMENINRDKYKIIPVGITKKGYWLSSYSSKKILKNNFKEVKTDREQDDISKSLIPFLESEVDVVFPLIHGPNGEDGKLQGLLEMINLPYVGTGVLTSAVGMDKAFMKKIFAYNNVPQGNFIILKKEDYSQKSIKNIINQISSKISFPCFVKPANMGSSIGISKVEKSSLIEKAVTKAFKYDDKIIIEEFIPGREIECSVLGNENIEVSLPGEIVSANEYYDYEAKYQNEKTNLIIPATIEKDTIAELRDISIKAFKALDGKGLARIDFFITGKDKSKILVNEINTIPGFTKYSMYPKLWKESGLPYSQLITKLIQLAFSN